MKTRADLVMSDKRNVGPKRAKALLNSLKVLCLYGNIHSRAYSGHVLRFLHVTGMVAMI